MRKSKKNILVLVETSRGYGRRIIEGITNFALENGHWSVFFEERGLKDPAPAWLPRWRGDGIITRTISSRTRSILDRLDVPNVELHGNGRDIVCDLRVDEDAVSRMVVDDFLRSGFERFAFFSSEKSFWTESRCSAFRRVLAERGIVPEVFPPLKNVRVFSSPVLVEKTSGALIDWLLGLPKPIALWSVTDLHAVYVLKACAEAGIAVPTEIAVLGTDNDSLLCRLCSPQLSSVDIGAVRLGYRAAQLLEHRMARRKKHPEIVHLPSHIEKRGSTDMIAVDDAVVAAAVQYIRDHSTDPIRIEEIAGYVGISKRSLQLRFKKALRVSPESELLRVRFEHAKTLLRESDLNVGEIGSIVGFASPEYFVRIFRRHCGATPGQYRRSAPH